VSLPVSLVVEEVGPVPQTCSVPYATINNPGECIDVPKAEIDPLPRQRVNSVCGVTDENCSGPNVSVAVEEP